MTSVLWRGNCDTVNGSFVTQSSRTARRCYLYRTRLVLFERFKFAQPQSVLYLCYLAMFSHCFLKQVSYVKPCRIIIKDVNRGLTCLNVFMLLLTSIVDRFIAEYTLFFSGCVFLNSPWLLVRLQTFVNFRTILNIQFHQILFFAPLQSNKYYHNDI